MGCVLGCDKLLDISFCVGKKVNSSGVLFTLARNNEKESDSEHETDESKSGLESNHDESEEDEDNEEAKISDKAEGDEDKEMDYTTSQLYDDMDIRLNEPFDTDKRFVQEEGTVAVMTNVQQENENPEILLVIEDAYVTLSTIPQKTEVPVTSSSHSSDLAAKFLNFLDIPHTDAEMISSLDVHVHHEVVLAKESSQPQSFYEAAATLTEFEEAEKTKDEDLSAGSDRGLQKRKTSKDTEPTKGPKAKESQSSSSKGDKSKSKSSGKSVQSEEPEFEVVDSDMPHDQEENLDNDDEPKEKVASKSDWFTKPTQPQEPNDPNWNIGKAPQQEQNQSWLMTLASSAKNHQKPLMN
nr:hypothetical protein [Tanacetum cinerariifolium]